jgi:hypothetical protein
MNKGILVILIAAIGLWTCDTKDSIVPLNESFFVKFYAGISEGDQFGEDIIATTDGGLLIAATSENTDGSSEILLIKTDNKGNEEWTYGSSGLGNNIVGKSVIELTDGYVVGGTTSTGPLDRSILIKVDFNGSLINSMTVFTDSLFNGTNIKVSNTLSKITEGHSGILVSGETLHFAAKGDGINGFIGLFDKFTLDSIESIRDSKTYKTYFGLQGDEIITGAYEMEDTLKDTETATRFVAFGSTPNLISPLIGYDFFITNFKKDYSIPGGIDADPVQKDDDQTSSYVTRDGDNFWMIGKTDKTGIGTKIFMTGWTYRDDNWSTINSDDIDGSTGVTGKGISVQTSGNYVIVGDETIITDVQTEIHLSRVGSDLAIKPPWPKNYGTSSAIYSSSAVVTLADGSIVIVGTADFNPIKKIVVIKTGPNGEMSF